MSRSLVRPAWVWAIAVVLVALATGNLAAEPLAIDALQSTATEAQKQIPEIGDAAVKFQNRDVEGAHKVLQDAVKKHPDLPPAEVIIADWFTRSRQDDAAQAWLEEAVSVAPNNPEAYVRLGDYAVQNRRWAEASLLLAKANVLLDSFTGDAKRKDGLEAAANWRLAQMAANKKDWTAAQNYVDVLLKSQPNNSVGLQLLARVLFAQKRLPEALEKLKAARMADATLPAPEVFLGEWYQQANDEENAKKQMAAALKSQPRDFSTRFRAASWAFLLKQYPDARAQAEYALQLRPDSLDAMSLAGTIAIFQKDYPTAEKLLKVVVAASPGDFAASNNLALALCEQDNKAKQELALRYAQLNEKLHSTDRNAAEALSTLGRTLFRLKHLPEAERAFRQALAANPTLSPDTAYYIAAIDVEAGRKDEAKDLLQKALKAPGLFASKAEAEALLKKLGP